MIHSEEVFKIGKFVKPHGIKGEIAMHFDNDIFDRTDCPYLVCLIDGIFVPFFIDEYRFKGSETALFLLSDINSEEKAKRLSGKEVYFPRKYYENEEENVDYSWNYFIGFTVEDKKLGKLGSIVAVDDSTLNTLFMIEPEGEDESIIIPATEDFVAGVDDKKKILYVELPEGLI
ncbi:ribosome maturation factor RimM [Dysgonomonas sp. 520]|uniref:ribosome maturation factor RimM n=1 Tax=Dysgonomonas sp. 520 TaxID=2302931 RepID=UPI0013D431F4|nr:ribosome maturation factor RimM [Dysgonomonas sp. 520]NDW09309.1 16S rRNA processing protein RimM [Dysgonomonas sp. 520]